MWFDQFSYLEMYAEKLDVFDCLDVDEEVSVRSLVLPDVHNELLCFSDIEGEVVYLAPRRQSA
jgi:hypothetical protein